MNYFESSITDSEISCLSSLSLAHLGDAVYELLVRNYLCQKGKGKVNNLHRETVMMVNANFQSAGAEIIVSHLTEEEAGVFRRGKNAKVNSVPHNSSIADYHKATALEAVFGWLYLKNRTERISELFDLIVCYSEF